MHGTVARLVPEQGFGFIRTDANEEYFFHLSALRKSDFETLAPGSRVEFTVKPHEHGDRADEHPRAVNVHLEDDEVEADRNEALPAEKIR
jgi:cold shock CspA family protein